MKKLFAIITATLVICGLCVAPAYADITNTSELKDLDHGINAPYYPTEVPTWKDYLDPAIDFDTPDVPGDYEFHLYGPWLGDDDQPLPYDKELTFDDGSGAYLAYAEKEYEAVSMVEQYVTDNQSEDKQFSEINSGTYEAVTETEWVVDQEGTPAWTERIEHAAETHTEAVTEEVSEGWAKCDKDGQSSYDFTGDKLIIHDGQSGYWFWSEQSMDNWKEFAESTGINKADQVATARVGYDSFTFGNKTFTIKPGNISANGGISWVAWEHFKTIEVGTKTVVDKEEWIEYIDHPVVPESGHYETKVIEPAVGWANVTWETIEVPAPVPPTPVPPAPVNPDPEDPVIPDEPSVEPSDNPDNPILDPVVEPVVPDNGNQQPAEVTITNTAQPAGQQYLPKTGDHLGDLDSIIAIICALCFGAIILGLGYGFERKE